MSLKEYSHTNFVTNMVQHLNDVCICGIIVCVYVRKNTCLYFYPKKYDQ
jgi:hypothetical protein